ncbi:hypothetical protein Agub_g3696, partial [Astrephomene gubernaculifera]
MRGAQVLLLLLVALTLGPDARGSLQAVSNHESGDSQGNAGLTNQMLRGSSGSGCHRSDCTANNESVLSGNDGDASSSGGLTGYHPPKAATGLLDGLLRRLGVHSSATEDAPKGSGAPHRRRQLRRRLLEENQSVTGPSSPVPSHPLAPPSLGASPPTYYYSSSSPPLPAQPQPASSPPLPSPSSSPTPPPPSPSPSALPSAPPSPATNTSLYSLPQSAEVSPSPSPPSPSPSLPP